MAQLVTGVTGTPSQLVDLRGHAGAHTLHISTTRGVEAARAVALVVAPITDPLATMEVGNTEGGIHGEEPEGDKGKGTEETDMETEADSLLARFQMDIEVPPPSPSLGTDQQEESQRIEGIGKGHSTSSPAPAEGIQEWEPVAQNFLSELEVMRAATKRMID